MSTQGKDHELSGCDILEQRTLDFAQLIQNTRDPVEAEELRFKSALCLFLSQRDTEELKTVVAAALKVLGPAPAVSCRRTLARVTHT